MPASARAAADPLRTSTRRRKNSLEEFTGLDWRAAKGRKPINIAECATLYARLWDEYLAENPHLGPVLTAASGIQDTFGQRGHQCQAIELWRIRAALLATAPTDARNGVKHPLRA